MESWTDSQIGGAIKWCLIGACLGGGHRGQFFGLVGSVGICMLSRNYLPRVLGKQKFHWGLKTALLHTDRGDFGGE